MSNELKERVNRGIKALVPGLVLFAAAVIVGAAVWWALAARLGFVGNIAAGSALLIILFLIGLWTSIRVSQKAWERGSPGE